MSIQRAAIPLLADENVPRATVLYLRERGCDVAWIAEDSPGISDAEVLSRARAESRLLFGFDLDLAERIVRGSDEAPLGLVLFRGATQTPDSAGAMLVTLLDREDLTLVGRITVVRGDHVRQRPFPPSR